MKASAEPSDLCHVWDAIEVDPASTQPRLNGLLRNRINKFRLDTLVNLPNQADVRVGLTLGKTA